MIALREIVNIVSMASGVEPAAISGHCRTRDVIRARGMAIWLAHRHAGMSSTLIGRYLGDRDHSTILAALKAFEEVLKTDQPLSELVERLAKLVAWKSYAAVDGERDALKIARSIYLDPRRAGMGASIIDVHALASTFLELWDIALAAEETARLYAMRQALREAGHQNLTEEEADAAELLDQHIAALLAAVTDQMAATRGDDTNTTIQETNNGSA